MKRTKMMTKELERKFQKTGRQEDVADPVVIAKYFNPYGRSTCALQVGILFALAVPPGPFFSRFFGEPPPAAETSLSEIRERMSRYDAALRELEEKGLLANRRRDED